MPELLSKYDWVKFGIRLTAVLLLEIGTVGTAMLTNLPPLWKLAIVLGCCKAAGNFIFGFFSESRVEVKPPSPPLIVEPGTKDAIR